MLKTVICLMGPTASGKTPLSLEIAHKLPIEIISVDSAMVYRGMDIGTAKPKADILKQIPHHLINICDPQEIYSAGRFRMDALALIDNILSRNKIPLLVGGTMLYYKTLENGLAILPERNDSIRAGLKEWARLDGYKSLHQYLSSVDPAAANKINPNDSQRIQRAIEVYLLTGQSLSSLQKEAQCSNDIKHYHFLNIALIPDDKTSLAERIEKRLADIFKNGFLSEVAKLYHRGDLSSDLPALKSVGYMEAWKFLSGEIQYKKMIEDILTATRQLAKRQMAWLKPWKGIEKIPISNHNIVKQLTEMITCNKCNKCNKCNTCRVD